MSDLEDLLKLTKSFLDRGDSIVDAAEKLVIDLTLGLGLNLNALKRVNKNMSSKRFVNTY